MGRHERTGTREGTRKEGRIETDVKDWARGGNEWTRKEMSRLCGA
jgi:hypothetical protein